MKSTNPSCSTPTELHSINFLARLLAADRRTLSKHLDAIPPRRRNGRTRYYTVADAHNALSEDSYDPIMRDLRRAKLGEEVAKLKRRNELEAGLLVKRADVALTITKIFGALVPRLEQILCIEYPNVVCIDPILGRIYGKRVFDQIIEAHREFADTWKEI